MSEPTRPIVVAIGCSWGGLGALSVLLSDIPGDLPACIVIVQHRVHAPSGLAALLGDHTEWPVCEAEDKEGLSAGQVFLAPPGYHLLVDGDSFALSTEGPVHFSRPSIDVFFESAAESFGRRVVGVVLTGSNTDGAAGLAEIVRHGGAALIQDPSTAEKPEMPMASVRSVPNATVVPLPALGASLGQLVHQRTRALAGAEG